MMDKNSFLYERDIIWSMFVDGFTVKGASLQLFIERTGSLPRGGSRKVTLVLGQESYDVTLVNLNNDKNSRKTDEYYIRYSKGSGFAKAMREIFRKSYNYIYAKKQEIGFVSRAQIPLPEAYKEYLVIYATEDPNTFLCDAILCDEIQALREIAKGQSERVFEAEFNYDVFDNTAGLNEKSMIVKVRHCNRKIGDSLKRMYDYRCQICGRKIGEQYGSNLVEAHHIRYFVDSLNNNMNNQMILCPNHHGIIHDVNPIFDWKTLKYTYPNGLVEGLKINKHLVSE